MTSSAPIGADTGAEASIRAQLARVLEDARASLSKIPVMNRRSGSAEIGSARALTDAVTRLLTEALELNDALLGVTGLSMEGAMCCGAVAVAVNAATDALAVVQAQIDSLAA